MQGGDVNAIIKVGLSMENFGVEFTLMALGTPMGCERKSRHHLHKLDML